MTRTGKTAAISDHKLERYRLGELPKDEATSVEKALETNPETRARLAALEASDAEILARFPPAHMAGAIRARLAERQPVEAAARPSRPWLLRPVPAAALGALAVVLAVVIARPLVREVGPLPSPYGDRLKGLTPSLILFRKTQAAPERLTDGALLRAGDVVQVAYRAAGRKYGVIVSVDGRGTVTLHLPQAGHEAAALKQAGPTVLASAYELDDAPLWERFYFVVGETPFDPGPVVAAAHRSFLAPGGKGPVPRLDLPRGLDQSVFVVRKETHS